MELLAGVEGEGGRGDGGRGLDLALSVAELQGLRGPEGLHCPRVGEVVLLGLTMIGMEQGRELEN